MSILCLGSKSFQLLFLNSTYLWIITSGSSIWGLYRTFYDHYFVCRSYSSSSFTFYPTAIFLRILYLRKSPIGMWVEHFSLLYRKTQRFSKKQGKVSILMLFIFLLFTYFMISKIEVFDFSRFFSLHKRKRSVWFISVFSSK